MSKKIRKFAYTKLGTKLEPHLPRFEGLEQNLQKAGIETSLRAYVSVTFFVCMIVFGVIFASTFILGYFLFLPTAILAWINVFLLSLICAFIGSGVTFALYYTYPSLKASTRKTNLDSALPSVAGYMAAMASAGVPPDKIFLSLTKREEMVSPEMGREAKVITRNIELLGYDILKALEDASQRSPSAKYSAFLEGMIATVVAGGDMKHYLSSETKTLMRDKEVETKDYADSLGVWAELYLTAIVVGPLFFVIMLSTLSAMGGGLFATRELLLLLVYFLIPIGEIAFILLISASQPQE